LSYSHRHADYSNCAGAMSEPGLHYDRLTTGFKTSRGPVDILGLTAQRAVAPPSRRLSWRRPAATCEGETPSRQPASLP